MKPVLSALVVLAFASAAAAHGTGHLHHHSGDPYYLPLLGGLFVIAAALAVGVRGRK
ncbi:hypothetical protein [Gymnodinialimonas ceratoperidinii]|uniref:Uncharacterized protein n=1 Tax=Gymnodinialimonas ceratoperidinii TaxID=2856823 RepID=A0A8F6TZD9_9RHOB|nr:hypothetical protein [Gymnodinialimonas ceratoperidinii]QXT40532.1 hypothetical protein KYE46_04620 [Gymnodinialimonas ceratoperidinii]